MPFKNEICSCFFIGSLEHSGELFLISPYTMYFEVMVWLEIALSWKHQQEPLCFCAINSHQFSPHLSPLESVPVIVSYGFRWGFVPGMFPRATRAPDLAAHLSGFSCSHTSSSYCDSCLSQHLTQTITIFKGHWKVTAQVKEIIQSCYFSLSWHSGFVQWGIMKGFSLCFFAWFTTCAYLFPPVHRVSSPHTPSFSWLNLLSSTQPG